MRVYQTKVGKLAGTNFHEVRKQAFQIYLAIKKRSKRKPYVRSGYFRKNKVFLDLFWTHLFEKKNFIDLMRRIKFYPCALELLQKSKFEPSSKENPNKAGEILHRFIGVTHDGDSFFVQVKEDKKSSRKLLLSVFSEKKKKNLPLAVVYKPRAEGLFI
ncbi:MAG: hypothetical protein HYV77_03270 [Candidatus Wildermuthbacteria bacterium]|nr:hypothetical protein [Candidatus Wildermuthbacteria bacterium]